MVPLGCSSRVQARVWIDEAGGELPPGNSTEADVWGPPSTSDAESSQSAASSDVKVSPFTKATVRIPLHYTRLDQVGVDVTVFQYCTDLHTRNCDALVHSYIRCAML